MIQLKISGRDKDDTGRFAETLGDRCRTLLREPADEPGSVEMMGPIESSLTRIAGRYRWQIIFKDRNTRALHRLVSRLQDILAAEFSRSKVRVAIDVDPIFLM
jgi:primosomal protein N' (replication factor Y)